MSNNVNEVMELLNSHEQDQVLKAEQAAKQPAGEVNEESYGTSIADISEADISGTNLSSKQLADLVAEGTIFSRCDMRAVNLEAATLTGATLERADLQGANLREAYLPLANISHADLRGADLTRANLSGANLEFADLRGAKLDGTILTGANLGSTGVSVFQFEQHPVIFTNDGNLSIGGTTMSIPEWQANFVGAAKDNGYTEQQTLMYARFIELMAVQFPAPAPVPASEEEAAMLTEQPAVDEGS